ncbi:hypothetical protein KOI35_37115 [Actinoplanes bogorensis]|uniref:DUF4352 domain-containing protein n=1 Tax=Paractinoplanes bogorensis TaxID=1610840 RepID=A0ABS5Z0C9_9ACTN|nr:hypothetical protein [Actinoplanes bogorensis]MBU2669149.1 hypothetical protein [Actinoplanes bogorensis]
MPRRSWSGWIAAASVVAAAGAFAAWATKRKQDVETGTSELPSPVPAAEAEETVSPAPVEHAPCYRWTALIVVAVVASVGGVIVGRATGSGPGTSSTAAQPDTARPGSPAPVPAGSIVPRNGSVVMIGDNGEQMTVSIIRVEDPELSKFPELRPATGDRLVSVTVNAANTGTVPFIAGLQQYAWVADDKGEWHQRNTVMTTALGAFPDALVEPRWEFPRTIVFELPESRKLTRLRLSLKPGVAAQTAEWTLT